MVSGMCIQMPSSHQQMHTAQKELYVKSGQEQFPAAASMEPKIEIVHLTVCDVNFFQAPRHRGGPRIQQWTR